MRRSPLFRSLAAILAVWFPLVAGEPGVVHPCAVHGGSAATASQPAAAHHQHHGASHDTAPQQSHHNCSCIGCCVVSTVALRAPDAATIAIAVVEYQVASTVPTVDALARPAPEFSRPYTTGPPRA